MNTEDQPGDQPDSLLTAVTSLSAKVENLSRVATVAQEQSDRTKALTRGVFVLATISLVVCAVVTVLLLQVRDVADANQSNAVTACQNANESRQANKALWRFILDASAQSPDQSRQEKLLAEQIRAWINDLYAPRDCSDLGKKYVVPPPPTIKPASKP